MEACYSELILVSKKVGWKLHTVDYNAEHVTAALPINKMCSEKAALISQISTLCLQNFSMKKNWG